MDSRWEVWRSLRPRRQKARPGQGCWSSEHTPHRSTSHRRLAEHYLPHTPPPLAFVPPLVQDRLAASGDRERELQRKLLQVELKLEQQVGLPGSGEVWAPHPPGASQQ